ncbi:hypothetical protein GGR57DRAFT_520812 [Xylariaceae sp. FL1272]|nr:hypothetical protein GGR57DRAFT_520812 [Xylariaceae sp. FL1272]
MSPPRFTKLFTRRRAKRNTSTGSIASLSTQSAEHSAKQSLAYLHTHTPPPLGQAEGCVERNARTEGFSSDSDYEEIDEMDAELDDGEQLDLAPTIPPAPMAFLLLNHEDEITFPDFGEFTQVMQENFDDEYDADGPDSDWTKVVKSDCPDDVREPDTNGATTEFCTTDDAKDTDTDNSPITPCTTDDDHILIREDDAKDGATDDFITESYTADDDHVIISEHGAKETDTDECITKSLTTDVDYVTVGKDNVKDADANEPVTKSCTTYEDYVMTNENDAKKNTHTVRDVKRTRADQTTRLRIHPLFRAKYFEHEFFSKLDMTAD